MTMTKPRLFAHSAERDIWHVAYRWCGKEMTIVGNMSFKNACDEAKRLWVEATQVGAEIV